MTVDDLVLRVALRSGDLTEGLFPCYLVVVCRVCCGQPGSAGLATHDCMGCVQRAATGLWPGGHSSFETAGQSYVWQSVAVIRRPGN